METTWQTSRAQQFQGWRAAQSDLDAQLEALKAATAVQAAARAEAQRTRWSRSCAAFAERSSKLSAAERARVDALLTEAASLSASGGDVAAAYEAVLEIDPANAEANYGLGELLRSQGELEAASYRLSLAAAYPKIGSDNGFFRAMLALQRMPPPADPRLAEPTVVFRVANAPTELWDAPFAPVMTIIPGGEYTMGSMETEPNHVADETPHRVTIAYPLAVSRYDVTRGEFAAFVEDTGYDAESHGDVQVFSKGLFKVDPNASWRNPGFDQTDDEAVTCVSWFDGVAYCEWLTRKTGRRYRLPSEAEWEYAVRGGTSTPYPWGNELGRGNCNCDGGGVDGAAALKPTPGGTFPPNGFGLYDVCGNVWTWLADAWNASYVGAPVDGSAWEEGITVLRGRRGGSWFNVSEARPGDVRQPNRMRAAARFGSLPHLRMSSFGLRVVAEV